MLDPVRKALEHGPKDNAMCGVEGPPIGQPPQPSGCEDAALNEPTSGALGDDLQLKPRGPRQGHVGLEPEEAPCLDGFDLPKVDPIPHPKGPSGSTDAPPRSSSQAIQSPTKSPSPLNRWPTSASHPEAPNLGDGLEGCLWGGINNEGFDVPYEAVLVLDAVAMA